jgi:hypothetical protein
MRKQSVKNIKKKNEQWTKGLYEQTKKTTYKLRENTCNHVTDKIVTIRIFKECPQVNNKIENNPI